MTKFRKNVIGAIMCLVMLLVGVCAFTACGSKDLSVTFTVEGKTQTVDVVNGKVTMPADPEKEFYEFRGWYTTSTFDEGSEFTKDTEVKENLTVYAYFAPVHVGISVNGEAATDIKLEELAGKTTEYTEDATSKNLTFDGWYIDAAYGTKYNTQDADNLYARYCATVTFDNGYETYETLVGIGSAVSKPANEDIVKFYMDSEDIFYVDAQGNEVDFTKPISTNTTITVLWKTPNLEFEVNQSTGNLYFKGFKAGVVTGTNATMGNYPVFSVPGKVTYNGELKTVESFCLTDTTLTGISYSFRKVIINEGVKLIGGFSGSNTSVVETIELPSTLEMVVDSFNNLASLKNISIPNGVEVILNSFWKNNFSSIATYDYDIAIPDSVINLAQVPTNLTFSANSVFKKIGNAIYQTANDNEKEILIAQGDVVDGTLTVKEGVKYVQAGALFSSVIGNVSYIKLPSTWVGIHYNASADQYAYYIAGRDGSMLYSVENSMADSASMIINNLESLERVLVYTTAYPSDASSDIICGDVDGKMKPYIDSTFADANKVVFIGTIADKGKVTVIVRATNRVTGETIVKSVTGIKSNQTALTRQKVLNPVGLWENNKYVILSETQFGEDYSAVYGSKVTCNQYIDIVFVDADGGYTYEKGADGVTITGFNEATAIDDGNNLFKVVIPAEIEGLPVIAIKAGAFKNNTSISIVLIPSSVKVIGAEAFMNTTNLTIVDIFAGGLETIGRSAFENSGFTSIKLPLSKLKDVEPYAFKSKKLKTFEAVKEEKDLYINDLYVYYGGMESMMPEVGSYMFKSNMNMEFYGLLKYTGKSTVKVRKNTTTTETMDVTVYDVQLVAICGGSDNWVVALGSSTRAGAALAGQEASANKPVFRYEIMEGSVYYLDNIGDGYGIEFGVISKVHKNAFTDINAKFTTITTNASGEKKVANTLYKFENEKVCDVWLELTDFSNTDIFEDGWWEGVMKSDADYKTKMEWVKYIRVLTDDHSIMC